jgi:hypothetical protein
MADTWQFAHAWSRRSILDDDKRKDVATQLEQLRKEVETRAGDASLLSEVDALRTLIADQGADRAHAQSSARGLEQKLLAWEAEHPTWSRSQTAS